MAFLVLMTFDILVYGCFNVAHGSDIAKPRLILNKVY